MSQQHKIGSHKTTVRVKDNILSVVYHSTEVVRADLTKKSLWLDNGGYKTATTKTRMNQALSQFDIPIRVFQRKYHWFIKRLWLPDDSVDQVSAFINGACLGY